MGRILLPLILFIASVGLFVAYTNPTYQKIKELTAENQQYDTVLTQSSQVRQKRDELLSRRNTFSKKDTDSLARLLPDNVDNIRLIIDANDIAARYHLLIKNVQVGGGGQDSGVGQGNAPVGSVGLSFTVNANYSDFLAFLADLQRSLRLVDIESVAFDSLNTGQSGSLDYKVSLRTYWLR